MAMEDVRDSLKENLKVVLGRVQESSAWIQLSEKFYGLSPIAQKGVVAGASLLGLVLLLLIPGIYFSSASSTIGDFESKRQLIRELYQVSHQAAAINGVSSTISAADLQSRAQNVISQATLQPEQILAVTAIPDVDVPGIAKSLERAGVNVMLSKLNLTQVIDIGYKLQTLNSNARMVGLDIKASASDHHYFDVTYKVVAFSPKPEALPGAKGAGGKGAAKPAKVKGQ